VGWVIEVIEKSSKRKAYRVRYRCMEYDTDTQVEGMEYALH
jgi:hypothetical protein